MFIDKKDLEKIGIHQWDEGFGDYFEGSDIFIGNGFSINICERLNYKALFKIFSNSASTILVKIFNELDTSNFEYVIDTLRISRIINKLLNSDINQYKNLIEEIKNGLIESIQKHIQLMKKLTFH